MGKDGGLYVWRYRRVSLAFLYDIGQSKALCPMNLLGHICKCGNAALGSAENGKLAGCDPYQRQWNPSYMHWKYDSTSLSPKLSLIVVYE